MLERFAGDGNLSKLINTLKKQSIVNGDKDIASAIAEVGEILEFQKGDTIIVQDNTDDDVILILTGRVVITVNGREVAFRNAGQHVGEMALIDPSLRRSASVIAVETTVVVKVSEPQFSPLAEQHPELWRRIAEGLAERLIQRNELVEVPNPRPTIFIGSSAEAIPIARAIQASFQHDEYLVRVWVDKIFGAGNATIEDLEHQVKSSDFAILVISADDHVMSRKEELDAPRDNVVFELGFFMGALTRHRTLLATPRGKKDLKIPSDLLGITTLQYTIGDPNDLPSLVAPMCEDVRRIVRKLGPK
ncbi:MAG: cyclic nucleotide-binding domain-containing protein [Hymenobacter sp.]|nr:MAG: cyclic nucleotide-binding domain-containing protein [Hymenobacter sp.]